MSVARAMQARCAAQRSSAAWRTFGRPAPPRRRMCSVAAAAGPSDVFVLDFDGVIVDSEREVR